MQLSNFLKIVNSKFLIIFIYYLTHLELFVAFSKVNNQLVSSFKHDGIIKETRGGNSNFDVILQILMRNKYVAHLGSSFLFTINLVGWFMVFNTTYNFSIILWQSVLLVEKTAVTRTNYSIVLTE
jgi:hypothetical protein